MDVKNVTRIMIRKPANEVFESFVDPARIGKFWFSSSSERWEKGKAITLRYDEYGAQGDITVIELESDRKIVFRWGYDGDGHVITILLTDQGGTGTLVEVTEEGFVEGDDRLIDNLLDNKEGWVYTLTCLKGYLEYGADLRASLVK